MKRQWIYLEDTAGEYLVNLDELAYVAWTTGNTTVAFTFTNTVTLTTTWSNTTDAESVYDKVFAMLDRLQQVEDV